MAADAVPIVDVTMTEELLPAYDASHGTPDAMLRRTLTMRVAGAEAHFEQTDYGHPGRFNEWVPRGIDARLQPRSDDLLQACDALSRLLK
jgi:hypothetical protein